MVHPIDDVDVCITCISEKPPKLPLREELPSLGVEVVYNARGLGRKAVKKETKRRVQGYQEAYELREQQKYRIIPRSKKRQSMKDAVKKRRVKELAALKSLSYDEYLDYLRKLEAGDDVSVGSIQSIKKFVETAGVDFPDALVKYGTGQNIDVHTGKVLMQALSVFEAKRKILNFRCCGKGDDSCSFDGTDDFIENPITAYDSFDDQQFLSTQQDKKKDAVDAVVSAFSADDIDMLEEANAKNGFTLKNASSKDAVDAAFAVFAGEEPPPIEKIMSEEAVDEALAVFSSPKNTKTGAANNMALASLACTPEKSSPWSSDIHDNTLQTSGWKGMGNTENGDDNDSNESMVDTDKSDTNNNSMVLFSAPKIGHKSDSNESTVNTRKSDAQRNSLALISPTGNQWWQENTSTKLAKIGSPEISCNFFLADTGDDCTIKNDWVSSAMSTFASGLLQGCGNNIRDPTAREPVLSNGLFSALQASEIKARQLHQVIDSNPSLVRQQLRSNGRVPLHVICEKAFPDRRSEANTDRTMLFDNLLGDIIKRRSLLEVVARADIDGCLVHDNFRDLPVHLLARRLITWEEEWKLWAEACYDENLTTQIYETMGECIELVLKPVATNSELCRSRGSVGKILPIHIASMFDTSLFMFQWLLDTYPQAAGISCDINALNTSIDINSLPIELLERPRVNKAQCGEVEPHQIKVGKPELTRMQTLPGGISRRSDLLFAYNPNVLPFRHDEVRLERIEAMIRASAKRVAHGSEDETMSQAVKTVWTWMCTFDDALSDDDNYVQNVRRIVDSLDSEEVKELAMAETPNGRIVIDVATPECARIIRSGMTSTETPEHGGEMPVLEDDNSKLHLGVLCKSIFNVKQKEFPTNFVILPYKLTRGPTGALTLESPDSASVAIKFAEVLLKLTAPWNISHILKKKVIEHRGQRIPSEDTKEWDDNENKYSNLELVLLSLYTNQGYFYFLDETTGVPIIHTSPKGTYPVELKRPVDVVKTLLPLMLMGMILMRGEKALIAIGHTLIWDSDRSMSATWVKCAHQILHHISSSEESKIVEDFEILHKELVRHLSQSASPSSKQSRPESDDGSEWIVEMQYLKLIIEKYDRKRTFGGLEAKDLDGNQILWTRDEQQDQSEDDITVISEQLSLHSRTKNSNKVDPTGHVDQELQDKIPSENQDESHPARNVEQELEDKIPSESQDESEYDELGAELRAELEAELQAELDAEILEEDQSDISEKESNEDIFLDEGEQESEKIEDENPTENEDRKNKAQFTNHMSKVSLLDDTSFCKSLTSIPEDTSSCGHDEEFTAKKSTPIEKKFESVWEEDSQEEDESVESPPTDRHDAVRQPEKDVRDSAVMSPPPSEVQSPIVEEYAPEESSLDKVHKGNQKDQNTSPEELLRTWAVVDEANYDAEGSCSESSAGKRGYLPQSLKFRSDGGSETDPSEVTSPTFGSDPASPLQQILLDDAHDKKTSVSKAGDESSGINITDLCESTEDSISNNGNKKVGNSNRYGKPKPQHSKEKGNNAVIVGSKDETELNDMLLSQVVNEMPVGAKAQQQQSSPELQKKSSVSLSNYLDESRRKEGLPARAIAPPRRNVKKTMEINSPAEVVQPPQELHKVPVQPEAKETARPMTPPVAIEEEHLPEKVPVSRFEHQNKDPNDTRWKVDKGEIGELSPPSSIGANHAELIVAAVLAKLETKEESPTPAPLQTVNDAVAPNMTRKPPRNSKQNKAAAGKTAAPSWMRLPQPNPPSPRDITSIPQGKESDSVSNLTTPTNIRSSNHSSTIHQAAVPPALLSNTAPSSVASNTLESNDQDSKHTIILHIPSNTQDEEEENPQEEGQEDSASTADSVYHMSGNGSVISYNSWASNSSKDKYAQHDADEDDEEDTIMDYTPYDTSMHCNDIDKLKDDMDDTTTLLNTSVSRAEKEEEDSESISVKGSSAASSSSNSNYFSAGSGGVVSVADESIIPRHPLHNFLEEQEAKLKELKSELRELKKIDSDTNFDEPESIMDRFSTNVSTNDDGSRDNNDDDNNDNEDDEENHDLFNEINTIASADLLSRYYRHLDGGGDGVPERESVSDDATTVSYSTLQSSTSKTPTKKILNRLCSLEEHLLSREIDLQKLKLDVHSFEMKSTMAALNDESDNNTGGEDDASSTLETREDDPPRPRYRKRIFHGRRDLYTTSSRIEY